MSSQCLNNMQLTYQTPNLQVYGNMTQDYNYRSKRTTLHGNSMYVRIIYQKRDNCKLHWNLEGFCSSYVFMSF